MKVAERAPRLPPLIKWNDANRIIEFKVMLRPLKAVNLIHERMGAMLVASRMPQ